MFAEYLLVRKRIYYNYPFNYISNNENFTRKMTSSGDKKKRIIMSINRRIITFKTNVHPHFKMIHSHRRLNPSGSISSRGIFIENFINH